MVSQKDIVHVALTLIKLADYLRESLIKQSGKKHTVIAVMST